METRTASRMPIPHDLAKTLRFRREEITTPFTRDADDTVPVELYSRPYERLDICPDSSPYERIEISIPATCSPAAEVPAEAPSSALRLVLTVLILCTTFALGVGFAFLVL